MDLLSTLVGVAFGAILSTALQQFVWKRQHAEEQKSLEKREARKDRARAVERFREVAVLLIETNCEPRYDQSDVNNATLIEQNRLRRELLAALAAVRDAFPELPDKLTERLAIFQRQMTQQFSPGSAAILRGEMNAIVSELRADVSISDK